jgi:hypothetical protein
MPARRAWYDRLSSNDLLEVPAVFETMAFLSTVTMLGIFTFLLVMNRRAAAEEEEKNEPR